MTTTVSPRFLIPPFPVRLFTVDEYHRLIGAGILTEEDAVELLAGWITPKVPRNPPHDSAVDQANEALACRLPAGWRVRVQSAITTPDSEPEPDLAVVPGPAARYRAAHPGPADVALVVEVADSSLARDRGEKARLYAACGLPVYWIVNLVDRQVEVFTGPTGPGPAPGYTTRRVSTAADLIPFGLPGHPPCDISGTELLP